MSDADTSGELIARLRRRAADPDRRTDAQPNTLALGGQLLDFGGLMRDAGGLGGLLGQLGETLGGLRDPERSADAAARARELLGSMSSPTAADLPEAADAAGLSRAETALGFALPALVRRLYLEIADGGFGPGYGLMPLARVASTYRDLRDESPGPPGSRWPDRLVPVIEENGDFTCVDCGTANVIAYQGEALLDEWDPDEPDDAAARRGWKLCFSEVAPTIEVWLERWLETPTVAESVGRQLRVSQEDAMANHRRLVRESMAKYQAMSPAERRKHISDETWEMLRQSQAEEFGASD